jgi:hypothetical protein
VGNEKVAIGALIGGASWREAFNPARFFDIHRLIPAKCHAWTT